MDAKVRIARQLRFLREVAVIYSRYVWESDRGQKTYHISYWVTVAILFGALMYAVVAVVPILILITAVCLLTLSLAARV